MDINQVIGDANRPDWDGNWTKSAAEIPWDGDTNGYGFTGTYTGWLDENLATPGSSGVSPLDSPTPMEYGSGPFQLTALSYASKFWAMTRNLNYWRGWPAKTPSLGGSTPAGYVNTIEETWAFTWGTRKALFFNGDCDFVALGSNQNLPEMYQHALGPGYPAYDPPNYPWDGIRCIHPLYELVVDAVFFTFDINPATFWGPIGSYDTFNINNIPRDFFGNETWGVHVRKAFAYAFDYATFLSSVALGEGSVPATAIIPGLLYYDTNRRGSQIQHNQGKGRVSFSRP